MCKQISSHLKMKLLRKYSLTNHMYFHLTVSKQVINNKYRIIRVRLKYLKPFNCVRKMSL